MDVTISKLRSAFKFIKAGEQQTLQGQHTVLVNSGGVQELETTGIRRSWKNIGRKNILLILTTLAKTFFLQFLTGHNSPRLVPPASTLLIIHTCTLSPHQPQHLSPSFTLTLCHIVLCMQDFWGSARRPLSLSNRDLISPSGDMNPHDTFSQLWQHRY